MYTPPSPTCTKQSPPSSRLGETDATGTGAAAHATRPAVVQAVPLSTGGVVATAVAQLASAEAVRGLPMGRVLCFVQHARAIPADGQSGEGDVAGRQTER